MKSIGAFLIVVGLAVPAFTQAPLFRFEDNFWINLHHFLYVLGRAKNNAPDRQRRAVVNAPTEVERATLSADERKTWDDAVAYYQQTLSERDAVFDDDLIAITNTLAAARAALPTTLAPQLRKTLERQHPTVSEPRPPTHRQH
jgi:hypothetical protein